MFKTLFLLPLVSVALLASAPAFADDVKDPTPEKRTKMAERHEKMAACLRSDKPLSECQTEMRAQCEQDGMSPADCPMGGKGPGRMKGGMRGGPRRGAPPAQN